MEKKIKKFEIKQTKTSLLRKGTIKPSVSNNKTADCKRLATDVHRRSLHEKPKPKPLKTEFDHIFKMPVVQVFSNKTQPRRSLSAENFQRTRHLNKHLPERILEKSEVTQSSIELNDDNFNKIQTRCSLSAEHLERKPLLPIVLSTPSPFGDDLQKRLNNWLKKRGKSVASFNNLKCLARQTPVIIVNDENKENNETEIVSVLVQYEKIVKAALHDLEKLIIDGLPLDQCEAWLRSIRQKYKKVDDESKYWECRAAVEQAKGNLSSAVDCYKTAIVKGAEVDKIDESLYHLMNKFSLLDIKPATEIIGKKDRLIKEARNIFISSIIQLAVQERNMKKFNANEKNCVVCPV